MRGWDRSVLRKPHLRPGMHVTRFAGGVAGLVAADEAGRDAFVTAGGHEQDGEVPADAGAAGDGLAGAPRLAVDAHTAVVETVDAAGKAVQKASGVAARGLPHRCHERLDHLRPFQEREEGGELRGHARRQPAVRQQGRPVVEDLHLHLHPHLQHAGLAGEGHLMDAVAPEVLSLADCHRLRRQSEVIAAHLLGRLVPRQQAQPVLAQADGHRVAVAGVVLDGEKHVGYLTPPRQR